MLNNNNNIIKIGILEVSEQNKAILEFYFDSAGKAYYQLASLSKADAFITDFDFPGAKENWENISAKFQKPAIILSIAEKQVPSAIWLAKPLSADSLTKAAIELQQLVDSNQQLTEGSETEGTVTEETLEPAISKQESLTEHHIKVDNPEPVTIKEELEAFALAHADSGKGEEQEVASTSDIMDFSDEVVEDEIKEVLEDSKSSKQDLSPDDKQVDELLASLINGEDQNKPEDKEETQGDELEEIPLMEQISVDEPSTGTVKQQAESASGKEIVEEVDFSDEHSLDIEGITENNTEDKHSETNEPEKGDDFALDQALKELEEEHKQELGIEENKNTDTLEKQIDALANSNDENLEEGLLDFELEPKKDKNDSSIENQPTESNTQLLDLEDETDDFEDLLADSFNEDTDLDGDDKRGANQVHTHEPESLEIKVDSFEANPENIVIEEKTSLLQQTEENVLGVPTDEITPPKSAEQELQSLLDQIREEADKSSNSKVAAGKPAARKKKRTFKPTNAEKRWDLLCGNNSSLSNKKDIQLNSFKLNEHLLATILDHLDQSKTSEDILRIKHKDCIIVIDYSMDYIYCDLSIYSDEYAELCYQPINSEKIKIHDLDSSEIRMYRKKIEEDPDAAHSVESFIWTTALLTSRGRLLENTDIKKKIGLKAWPNLTRVENIPHAMNIAAVFSKHPGSLEEVTHWLKIPQRYIFSFYNAAFFLDLIELDSSKFKKSRFTFENKKKEQAKERGFFSRLLKRITS